MWGGGGGGWSLFELLGGVDLASLVMGGGVNP